MFIGKRKTYAKRVESERIRVDSKYLNPNYSVLRPFTRTTAAAPSYQLSMSYIRLTNAGKTLIHKACLSLLQVLPLVMLRRYLQGKEQAETSFAEFFDEDGKLDTVKFESWVSALMARVMGIRSTDPILVKQ